MRVVVTGAAGFIGSHLTERYLRGGQSVVCIDNLVTGTRQNLGDIYAHERFRFIHHDVSRPWAEIDDQMIGADLVLHFASPASPVDYGALPVETMLVNSQGTLHAVDYAISQNARFLLASTSETYGDPLEHPQRETYWGNVNPTGVRSCYDESKRFAEALTMAYVRTKNLDGRIIRIFNTYGPRMRRNDGRVVPNFVAQALEGLPLTIYGTGAQTRSFCYVDDLIEGISRCAASDATRGTIINLGNPDEHEIREFAELVCEIAGVPLRVEHHDAPPDDPRRRCPDISRATQLLGWVPRVTLRDGLTRTIGYFRSHLARVS